MKNTDILFAAVCFVSAVVCAQGIPSALVPGEVPAISPDGRRLAFQRVEDRRMHLGVLDLETGKTEWIVCGATAETKNENACHPAWGSDGELVFAYANLTNTAYQRFHSKDGAKEGYRIRTWRDGKTTDLVGGFARNYSPSFSPDGKAVYFCRQDGKENARICVLDRARPDDIRTIVVKPAGDSGVNSPNVSPDGKLMAWAEIMDVGVSWRIRLARVAKPAETLELTTCDLAGYAPSFLPDSRHLLFTGFRKGDPCWGVYLIDCRTGAFKRLADGEDPCTADGRTVYYAKDGMIRRLSLDETVFSGLMPQARKNVVAESERVIVRCPKLVPGEPVAIPADDAGPQATRFMRFTFDMDDAKARRPIADACWGGKALLHFFNLGGVVCFLSREQCDKARKIDDGRRLAPGPHRVTGVRADGVVHLSVDGGPAVSISCGLGFMPVAGDGALRALGPASLNVRDVEYGIGWPKNVPPPMTGERLFSE